MKMQKRSTLLTTSSVAKMRKGFELEHGKYRVNIKGKIMNSMSNFPSTKAVRKVVRHTVFRNDLVIVNSDSDSIK